MNRRGFLGFLGLGPAVAVGSVPLRKSERSVTVPGHCLQCGADFETKIALDRPIEQLGKQCPYCLGEVQYPIETWRRIREAQSFRWRGRLP